MLATRAHRSQNLLTASLLFLLVFFLSCAYETNNEASRKVTSTLLFPRGSVNSEPCCPCMSARQETENVLIEEDCCPCAFATGRRKIPLAPFPRNGPFFNDMVEDDTIESCVVILGDLLSSPPSCVSYKRHRVDCFYVSAETQTVHQKTIQKGEPLKSVDTGGKVRDEVVSIAISSNKFTLVALDHSNRLISRARKAGAWTDWTIIEDAMALEVPAAFMRNGGGVTCFYRSLNNELWYVERSRNSDWYRPKKLDMESMVTAPTCLERGDGDAEECFALSVNNSVAHEQWLVGGEWTLHAGLGGHGKNRISVTSSGVDRLDVFMLGVDNQLMHRAFVEEEWKEWEDLGGNFVSSPECVAVGEESLHCFLIGVERTLMHKSFDGEMWSAWVSSSQSYIEKPSCVVVYAKTIACYTRGYTGHMVEIIYKV